VKRRVSRKEYEALLKRVEKLEGHEHSYIRPKGQYVEAIASTWSDEKRR
jgi:hypothetical protein